MFFSNEKEEYKELNDFKTNLENYKKKCEEWAFRLANEFLTEEKDKVKDKFYILNESVKEIAQINFILDLFTYLASDYAKIDKNDNKNITYYKSSGWFKKPNQQLLENLIDLFKESYNNDKYYTKEIEQFILELNNNKNLKDLKIIFNIKKYISKALIFLSFTLMISSLFVGICAGSLEGMFALLAIGAALYLIFPSKSKSYTIANEELNQKTDIKNIKPIKTETLYYLKNCEYAKKQSKMLEDIAEEVSSTPIPGM